MDSTRILLQLQEINRVLARANKQLLADCADVEERYSRLRYRLIDIPLHPIYNAAVKTRKLLRLLWK